MRGSDGRRAAASSPGAKTAPPPQGRPSDLPPRPSGTHRTAQAVPRGVVGIHMEGADEAACPAGPPAFCREGLLFLLAAESVGRGVSWSERHTSSSLPCVIFQDDRDTRVRFSRSEVVPPPQKKATPFLIAKMNIIGLLKIKVKKATYFVGCVDPWLHPITNRVRSWVLCRQRRLRLHRRGRPLRPPRGHVCRLLRPRRPPGRDGW